MIVLGFRRSGDIDLERTGKTDWFCNGETISRLLFAVRGGRGQSNWCAFNGIATFTASLIDTTHAAVFYTIVGQHSIIT